MTSIEVTEYLPRLVAIFFAVFDDQQGLQIVYEVPEGLASTATSDEPSLFDQTSDYVIPRQGLCGHLVTICTKQYKVLGFPVSLQDATAYQRQIFVFNVAFVFDRDAELAAYEPIVRKTGRVLAALEQSSLLLSSADKRVRMYSILEQLYEDLNTYSEARIQLDEHRALDLSLFPVFPNPPPVNDWDVPVLLVDLSTFADSSWDLTVLRMLPLIDGTKCTKTIAVRAEVDIILARECLQHLLYYSCILMIDLFQHSNSYALVGGPLSLPATASDVPEDGIDPGMECSNYVSTGQEPVPPVTLLRLYAKLAPSYSVSEWMEDENVYLLNIDVRRMMSFGVIKGFLRRCFCYPVWLDHPEFAAERNGPIRSRSHSRPRSEAKETPPADTYPLDLPLLLDGTHHTDELCLQFSTNVATLKEWFELIGANDRFSQAKSNGKSKLTSNNRIGRVELIYL